jgi:hypothetical protein
MIPTAAQANAAAQATEASLDARPPAASPPKPRGAFVLSPLRRGPSRTWQPHPCAPGLRRPLRVGRRIDAAISGYQLGRQAKPVHRPGQTGRHIGMIRASVCHDGRATAAAALALIPPPLAATRPGLPRLVARDHLRMELTQAQPLLRGRDHRSLPDPAVCLGDHRGDQGQIVCQGLGPPSGGLPPPPLQGEPYPLRLGAALAGDRQEACVDLLPRLGGLLPATTGQID